MAAEWRETTWGEVISLDYGKALRDYDTGSGKFRVFGSNGPIGWTSQPLAPGPGVILGRKGAYRGVEFSRDPFFVIDTAYYVVPKTELDMRWLYYSVKHHKLGEIDDGSPIPSTTRAAVYVQDLQVPPFTEQKAIAAVLGALDDKIELNRRMNETLEAMAQNLFKSWFVDFEPTRRKGGCFQDSPLGKIPEGWRVSRLNALTSKIGSGATPRGGSAVYVSKGVAFIRSQNVYDNEFCWAGLARLTDKSAEELRGVEVKAEDILFNITGDSILRTCVVDPDVLPARVNQHVLIIRAAPSIPPRFLHLFLIQPRMKQFLAGLDAGATRQAVTKAQLELVEVLHPPKDVLDRFAAAIGPIFGRIDSTRSESRTLAALRDVLLPKLLSGELRAPDTSTLKQE